MALTEEMTQIKKTPLYDLHQSLGGKVVDFHGWALPIQYSGIVSEHLWVRSHCGFFDVSHLGEVRVAGKGSFDFLQARLTNDLSKLQDGRIQYQLLCDERGNLIDDLLVHRVHQDEYWIAVNAVNIEADLDALRRYSPDTVSIEDESDATASIAVQGPDSENVLSKGLGLSGSHLSYYSWEETMYKGVRIRVSRSGYTGEDGFEIYCPNELAPELWKALVLSEPYGARPAGLGARNTLRLEAGNGLYGNEMDIRTTPIEAGLQWAVSFTKGRFVGRDMLLKQKESGPARKLIGFRLLDKAIAREHYPVFHAGRREGEVTSGSFAPSLGYCIGMAYVSKDLAVLGTKLDIEIHQRLVPAEVVRRPFVELQHKKNKGA